MNGTSTSPSYKLTIQCSLDGFCFVLYDTELGAIVDTQFYQTTGNGDAGLVIEAFDKAAAAGNLNPQNLQAITFIAENQYNTIVPEALFDPSQAETYLRFNHDIPQGYRCKHDYLPTLKAMNVFAYPEALEAHLSTYSTALSTTHLSSIFLESILKEAPKGSHENAFVHLSSRNFNLGIVKDGQLIFYNNFNFNTKDDFAYFLMFAIEHQGLSGQDLPVCFSGLVTPNSEIIKLTERYISRIRFLRPDGSVNVQMANITIPFQYYYIPYKSISCESLEADTNDARL